MDYCNNSVVSNRISVIVEYSITDSIYYMNN